MLGFYRYFAIDINNRYVEGYWISRSRVSATEELKAHHLNVQKIHFSLNFIALIDCLMRLRKLSEEDVLFVFENLAVVYRSSSDLSSSCTSLANFSKRARLKFLFTTIGDGLKAGRSLTDCLKSSGKIDSKVVLGIIESGEKSGNLGNAFESVVDYENLSLQLTKIVGRRLFYPAMLVFSIFVIITFLANSIFPEIISNLQNADFPVPNELLTLVFVFQWDNLLIAVSIFSILAFFFMYSKNTIASKVWNFLIMIPILKDLTRRSELIRFALTLAISLRGNIDAERSLYLAISAIRNSTWRNLTAASCRSYREGSKLNLLVGSLDIIDPRFSFIVNTVESRLELSNLLHLMAERNMSEAEQTFEKMATFIEPAIILILGLAILIFVIKVFVPILDMSNLSF